MARGKKAGEKKTETARKDRKTERQVKEAIAKKKDVRPCPLCYGTGKQGGSTCRLCGGSGR